MTFDYIKLRLKGKSLDSIVYCDNPEIAEQFYNKGQGMILYTGHLANWEMTFLEESNRMQGMMVAQRFFVAAVADWIDAIRKQFGGHTVTPDEAVSKGVKSLRQGLFVGIAGDQALPEGSHYYRFLGARAWTTVTPAVWAYRSNSPIIMVLTRRESGRYITHHSEPIWPDIKAPFKSEIQRMMGLAIKQLETAIKARPGEYLWLHNRWRQDVYKGIKNRYQHDVMLVILPNELDVASALLPQLKVLAQLYPRALITLLQPHGLTGEAPFTNSDSGLQIELQHYHSLDDVLLTDWRYQMVFNFSQCKKVQRHYLKLAAFEVIDMPVDKSCVANTAASLRLMLTEADNSL